MNYYQQGRDARKAKQRRTENPYRDDVGTEFGQWDRGWVDEDNLISLGYESPVPPALPADGDFSSLPILNPAVLEAFKHTDG